MDKELSTDQSILLKNLPKASTELLFLLRTDIIDFVFVNFCLLFGKMVTVKWSDSPKGGFFLDFGKICPD